MRAAAELAAEHDRVIVLGLRAEPETVRELFDQYCRGLIDAQLDKKRQNVPHHNALPTSLHDASPRFPSAK